MSCVLVAIVTYEREKEYLIPLLEALQAQSVQHFDLLFVDNSTGTDYTAHLKETLPSFFPPDRWHVLHIKAGNERFQRILKSRAAARAFFLEREYDHLWWLDSDVIPPNDALEQLLATRAELVTGIYLVGKEVNGKDAIVPPILLDIDGEHARQALLPDVLREERIPVGAAGLGCTLAARSVVEQVALRLNPHGTGEDIMFYRDAAALGVQPLACCTVRCQHLTYPLGDPRNARFDAARYKLG